LLILPEFLSWYLSQVLQNESIAKKFSMQFYSSNEDLGPLALHIAVCCPDSRERVPLVLFLPDLLLSNSFGFYPWFAEAMSKEWGAMVARLSPQLQEEERGGGGIGDPEEYSLGRETVAVLSYIAGLLQGKGACVGEWDKKSFIIVGHGKGCALGLHLDRRLRVEGLPSPDAIILMNSPGSLLREPRQSPPLVVQDDGSTLALGDLWSEDLEALAELSPLEEIVETTSTPLLMVVAEEGGRFPVSESERLFSHAGREKDSFLVIEKTGHSFSTKQPFEGPSPELKSLLHSFGRFVQKGLAPK
jgi:pimeloyl-ACP methyl ester carboxylesterase